MAVASTCSRVANYKYQFAFVDIIFNFCGITRSYSCRTSVSLRRWQVNNEMTTQPTTAPRDTPLSPRFRRAIFPLIFVGRRSDYIPYKNMLTVFSIFRILTNGYCTFPALLCDISLAFVEYYIIIFAWFL